MREGIELSVEADVSGAKLNAIFHVGLCAPCAIGTLIEGGQSIGAFTLTSIYTKKSHFPH